MHGRMQVKMRGGQSLSLCAVRGCRCGSDARCAAARWARKVHFTTCRVIYFLHDYLSYSSDRLGSVGGAGARVARRRRPARARGYAARPGPGRQRVAARGLEAGSGSRVAHSEDRGGAPVRRHCAVHTRNRDTVAALDYLLEHPPDPYGPRLSYTRYWLQPYMHSPYTLKPTVHAASNCS